MFLFECRAAQLVLRETAFPPAGGPLHFRIERARGAGRAARPLGGRRPLAALAHRVPAPPDRAAAARV